MWYVIQTETGREEELIALIQTILNRQLYKECFVIQAEWMKRLGGEWRIQVRPLFPGYVLIDTEQPENVFLQLKGVPRSSKILGSGKYEFTAVNEAERRFLEIITSNNKNDTNDCTNDEENRRIVRLTELTVDPDGKVQIIRGLLQYFEKDIIKINLHKRYATVRTKLFHRDRTLVFGVRLEEVRGVADERKKKDLSVQSNDERAGDGIH